LCDSRFTGASVAKLALSLQHWSDVCLVSLNAAYGPPTKTLAHTKTLRKGLGHGNLYQ
jgi:hypothetical protein